jgi:hypothetical protein
MTVVRLLTHSTFLTQLTSGQLIKQPQSTHLRSVDYEGARIDRATTEGLSFSTIGESV